MRSLLTTGVISCCNPGGHNFNNTSFARWTAGLRDSEKWCTFRCYGRVGHMRLIGVNGDVLYTCDLADNEVQEES